MKYFSEQQHFIFRQEAEAPKAKILKSPFVQLHDYIRCSVSIRLSISKKNKKLNELHIVTLN